MVVKTRPGASVPIDQFQYLCSRMSSSLICPSLSLHSLSSFTVFILFHVRFSVSTYNYPCMNTGICHYPGMICVNRQCKCDSTQRLFWTGARCQNCPHLWTLKETACLGLVTLKMNWADAATYCYNMKAALISLKDNSILSTFYEVTGNRRRRRRQTPALMDRAVGWTSAYALQLTSFGVYQWADPTLNTFDSRHQMWCRKNITSLGYNHPHNEPTRLTINGESEKCVLFRRGISIYPMLCLDDVMCSEKHSFICERTESTSIKFFGPPVTGQTNGNTLIITFQNTQNNQSQLGTDSNSNQQSLSMLGALSDRSKSKKSPLGIIGAILALLMVLAAIFGIFIWLKCRKLSGENSNSNPHRTASASSQAESIGSHSSADHGIEPSEASSTHSELNKTSFPAPLAPATSRKAGYSKQNFDEFQ